MPIDKSALKYEYVAAVLSLFDNNIPAACDEAVVALVVDAGEVGEAPEIINRFSFKKQVNNLQSR